MKVAIYKLFLLFINDVLARPSVSVCQMRLVYPNCVSLSNTAAVSRYRAITRNKEVYSTSRRRISTLLFTTLKR